MNKKNILHLVALLLSLALPAGMLAESTGTWKLFLCYKGIENIMPAGKTVYVQANGNLYSHNISDNTATGYSKLDILSGSGIKHIQWCKATGTLVVAYKDLSIDIISNNGSDTKTITAIKDRVTTYDKTFNSLYADGQYVYVCAAFGIVKVNTANGTIATTYNIGKNIMELSVSNGFIYAKTNDDIVLRADTKANLMDKEQWVEQQTAWEDVAKKREEAKNSYGIIVYDEYNKCYWGSNANQDLTRYAKEDGQFVAKTTGISPDGPPTNTVWRVYKHNGKLYCTAGIFADEVFMNKEGLVYYMIPETEEWHTLEAPPASLGYQYYDANVMVFDPKDKNHFFVGSRSGVYEYRNDKFVKAYTSLNNTSTLSPLYDNPNYINISLICSMMFDAEGTLWMLNGWCNTPIVSYNPAHEDGKFGGWKSYPQSGMTFASLYTLDMQTGFISNTYNRMWFVNTHWNYPALYCYDYKNNKLQYNKTKLTPDGQEFFYTNCVVEDKEHNIWVGTDDGPLIITPAELKAGELTYSKHKIARNDGTGLADYLLDNVNVKYIAIDAANRKWIGGKDGGVFLISDDNNTQLARFTVDNSPLLSDAIFSITIDEETGWVYFATDEGLCAYKADVTDDWGSDLSDGHVYAYPNPVTPEHTGMITITGLTKKSQIKITTAGGYVVNSGTSSSGSYEWDGRDSTGKRVASGIYMVLTADEDGEKGCVTKIAVVN